MLAGRCAGIPTDGGFYGGHAKIMVVIPIYNLLMVPDANIYLKSDQYRHLARRYAEVNDRVVLLSCRKEEHR